MSIVLYLHDNQKQIHPTLGIAILRIKWKYLTMIKNIGEEIQIQIEMLTVNFDKLLELLK